MARASSRGSFLAPGAPPASPFVQRAKTGELARTANQSGRVAEWRDPSIVSPARHVGATVSLARIEGEIGKGKCPPRGLKPISLSPKTVGYSRTTPSPFNPTGNSLSTQVGARGIPERSPRASLSPRLDHSGILSYDSNAGASQSGFGGSREAVESRIRIRCLRHPRSGVPTGYARVQVR
jgi:hypothetical protein